LAPALRAAVEHLRVPTELPTPGALRCDKGCAAVSSIEALNQSCYCLSVDPATLRRDLAMDLKSLSLSEDMITTHPHLFSSVPMFVSRAHLERMAGHGRKRPRLPGAVASLARIERPASY
jgi:hypothetical protein